MSATENVPIAWLNGAWTSPQGAQVSALDRGFLFGDGIYEVIPVYNGKPFRLTEHLDRLASSLSATSIPNPRSNEQWQSLFAELAERNGGGDQAIYLQITRGAQPVRDHRLPDALEPTVFAMSSPLAEIPQEVRKHGVSAITKDDIRWQWCHIKSISLLANVLLKHEASAEGANECILLRDGMLTEGATSNVFVVRNNVICTPPKSQDLLPGITRDLILELALAAELKISECALSKDELRTADELWISSSTRELYPVTSLDDGKTGGGKIGNGKPGPLWAQLYEALQAYKRTYA